MASLEEVKDTLIGKKGNPDREEYEFELKLKLIGDMIQIARKDRNLTQEHLGMLIGVKKAQISRLENNTGNITMETILKIFNALDARVNFNVQMLNKQVKLT